MKVNVKTDNIEITPAISDYLDKKINSFNKFIKEGFEAFCNIEIGKTTKHHKSGEIFKTEISLSFSGNNFNVVSKKNTLYEAIDEAKDEMIKLLSNNKSKKITLLRRGGIRIKKMLRGFRNR